jgi:hypothetical protein
MVTGGRFDVLCVCVCSKIDLTLIYTNVKKNATKTFTVRRKPRIRRARNRVRSIHEQVRSAQVGRSIDLGAVPLSRVDDGERALLPRRPSVADTLRVGAGIIANGYRGSDPGALNAHICATK